MTKKLIALDLDGTLLRPDNTISDYTIQTIQKIRAKGHYIVIATGRPYRLAIDYYHLLDLDTPMISFNGSLIHLPHQKWAWERSYTVDKKYLFEILRLQKDFQADFIASEYRKKFFISACHPSRIDPNLFGVERITDKMMLDTQKITENPNALLMQTQHPDKYALAAAIAKHFQHNIEVDSWGGPLNILEFAPKGVNKASALDYLLGVLNLDRKQLIAFGDEHNDTQMLSFAHCGYAMKNANPDLLPFADKKTNFTNAEDGVARELEHLLL